MVSLTAFAPLIGVRSSRVQLRAQKPASFVCTAQKRGTSPGSITRRQVLEYVAVSVASVALVPLCGSGPASAAADVLADSAYDISVIKNGKPLSLDFLKGKTTLFVNVASYCALTPQYEGLVSLHEEFQRVGFEVIASPCDQFARQEPGTNDEVCAFAKEKFGARFLLLDKLQVNDAPGGVAPLYKFLKSTSPDYTSQRISWNFEKFLVGADGKVLRRYKPGVRPENIRPDIVYALANPGKELPPRPKPYLGVE